MQTLYVYFGAAPYERYLDRTDSYSHQLQVSIATESQGLPAAPFRPMTA